MLSFQAADMKEKAQLATSESRDVRIPVKQDKECNGTRRQQLAEQPLENTPNPGKTMSYFYTF